MVGPMPYKNPNMNGSSTLFFPVLNDSKEVNKKLNYGMHVELVLEVQNSIENIRNCDK
jgi:hypothetical protein